MAVVYIAGASGAGKTTLMHKLKRKYPKLIVMDEDEWYEQEAERLGHKWNETMPPGLDSKIDDAVRKRVSSLVKRYKNDPRNHVVIAGIQIHPSYAGMHRIMLSTGVVKSTYRQYAREVHDKIDPLVGMRDKLRVMRRLPGTAVAGARVIQRFKKFGYTKMSSSQIEKTVGALFECEENVMQELLERAQEFLDEAPRLKATKGDRHRVTAKRARENADFGGGPESTYSPYHPEGIKRANEYRKGSSYMYFDHSIWGGPHSGKRKLRRTVSRVPEAARKFLDESQRTGRTRDSIDYVGVNKRVGKDWLNREGPNRDHALGTGLIDMRGSRTLRRRTRRSRRAMDRAKQQHDQFTAALFANNR